MFGRATITLGIGPHSSLLLKSFVNGVFHCMHIDCTGVLIWLFFWFFSLCILYLLMGLEPVIE